jgi:hypothetical protein
LGLAFDKEFLEARCGRRDRAGELGVLGACETSSMLLLSTKDGVFECPKALMGLCQLSRRGQLRVGDDHHFAARTMGVRGSRGRSRLLMRYVFFGLVGPGSAAFALVGLGLHGRLGNKLSVISLVDTCFTVRIDLSHT